ncbi:MAG: LamG-like jellyroll fold domain-containing protein [Polyangiaceae bacterium]
MRLQVGFAAFVMGSTALFGAGCGDSSGEQDAAGSGASSGSSNNSGGESSGDSGSSNGGSGSGGSLACPDPAQSEGLTFDGVDDHVTMGVAAELGLEQFTIEAWVRRDGGGIPTDTGQGGVYVVPIAGRGRGENDDPDKNVNYLFGFVGENLGAVFEDNDVHDSHTVLGATPVVRGEWHHVAASYDGTTWRLYLDGLLDGEHEEAGATPQSDSVHHFGLGSAFNSLGEAKGRLHGVLDEVRVWDHALADADVANGMWKTITQGDGMLARWALDGDVSDSVGALDGTAVGEPKFSDPAAILDAGLPPELTALPEQDAVVSGAQVALEVDIDDGDSDSFVVDFHVRPVTDGDDFTIVVLPDTQYYTVQGNDYEYLFEAQTQWVRDNRKEYNIVGLIHNGDIVDKATLPYQWTVANGAMSILETPEPDLPEGVAYGVCAGNHDQAPNGTVDGTAEFNKHFGVARFQGRSYYGGHYGADNDENFVTFNAGGVQFVAVNLQFRPDGTDSTGIDWARTVFEANPDAFGILNTHGMMFGDGGFDTYGKAIYAGLKDVDNLQLMTCGHRSAESRRTDTDDATGNVIHSMLADYQSDPLGGGGFMRIWEFSPRNNTLTVRSYSPGLDKWLTEDKSEFTLPVDLSGSGGDFAKVATVDPATAKATATFADLEPGGVYEWYATVSDCAHQVSTPVQRFTVGE